MSHAKITDIIRIIRDEFETVGTIHLHEPFFGGNEKKYLAECIDTTFVSSVGPFVDRFEKEIAQLTNTQKGVAVVNGTAALQVAVQLVGVVEGDEVITQALTFVATANAISYNRAKPIFIDVDKDTMGLSPSALEAFLNENGEIRESGAFNKKSGKKIGACIVMHTFGFPARIHEIATVCLKWNIPLIEDAAESLGSLINEKPLGGIGNIGILSFNGNKIVTSGGGGAIVSNDKDLADRAKHLTTTAKVKHPFEYIHNELGYNFRMPNINAALLCAQLEQLDTFLEKKRDLAIDYKNHFEKIGINFRWELPNTKANFWLMCLEFNNLKDRNLFLNKSNQTGVMTRPIWQLMSKLDMYKDCQNDGLENSRFLEDRIVNIPSSVRK